MIAIIQNIANQTIGPIFDSLEKLSWLGTSTHFIKFPFLDEKLAPIAVGLGMGLPVIKVLYSDADNLKN